MLGPMRFTSLRVFSGSVFQKYELFMVYFYMTN